MNGPLAKGQRGMVSSAHPLATAVGTRILKQGGNAFDAAVATAAALNVVEPMMSGIGGYGTILVYDAAQHVCRFLNTSDRIPRGVNSDQFRPPTRSYLDNRRGPKAVSTPGNVRGWQALWQTYGRLPWTNLLQPAIELAQGGFRISPHLAQSIRRFFDSFPAQAQAIYGGHGQPLQENESLVQLDLAHSLSQIAAEGPDYLYGGPLGQQITAALQAAGSFLTLADLVACEAEWWEPVSIAYQGVQIFTAAPPATSFAALVRLGLMSQFDVTAMGHNSAKYLHHFAEVTKHAYRCRLEYAADPAVAAVPFDKLFSPAYWQDVAAGLNLSQATSFQPPAGTTESSSHTTHFVIADAAGNIVSATQTIGQLFGSRIMPPGTGIWLNNSLQYCTFEPKGNPMDAHAGRRKLSGDCPVILFRQGRPWVALGTPGGHTIPQTVPQIVINLVDFGMDMAAAIAHPRISFAEPDQLLVDPSLATESQQALAQMGHSVVPFPDGLGNAHGLTIAYDHANQPLHFTGAADPRGEGLAQGV